MEKKKYNHIQSLKPKRNFWEICKTKIINKLTKKKDWIATFWLLREKKINQYEV